MKDLLNAIDEFKKRKVMVVGDIFLDKSAIGSVERLNPENNSVPLIKVENIGYALGGAGNVARNLASLGADTCLFGQIGKDEDSERIEELCFRYGIKTHFAYSDKKTIVKLRLFSDGQYIARADFGEEGLEGINSEIEGKLERTISDEMGRYDLVIFSDYDKGIFRTGLAKKVIEMAKRNKVQTLVDPKPVNIGKFAGCDGVRPNRHEAELISGIKHNGENLGIIAEKLAEIVSPKYVVITCGGDGAFGYDVKTGQGFSLPAEKRKSGDTIGAGDTFAAVLGLTMASKISLENSIKLANYASGIVVGKTGTSAASISELREELTKSL